MNDLFGFLTSSEAILVYIVAGLSCCLCLIIYFVERNNVKLRQRHNTKELNKLVSQIKEEVQVEEQPMYEVPVLQTIEESTEASSVSEMLDEIKSAEPVVESVPEVVVEEKKESLELEPVDILKEAKEAEELEYTSIEPDQATAQLELQKLTEELKRQEEMENAEVENSSLTSYEAQQEENAIISLEELVQKSKDIYQANELTQYVDEGNEPISLQELEKKIGKEVTSYQDSFVIENVVPKEEVVEEKSVSTPVLQSTMPVSVEPAKKFKSSPIISPIYGIEKQSDENHDIELENTANYEKLDAEIKKTNEFLMTLKDLQQKLD